MPRKLTGRIDITSVVPVDPTHWTIQGSFSDETGTFGPGDVAVNNRLFAYSQFDNTLRYRVSSISVSSNPMTFVVEWDDEGAEIEPPTGFAAITEVSPNNALPEEPSFQQQLLDEPLVTGIRAQTMRAKIDNLSGGGGGAANTKNMVAGGAIAIYRPVSKRPDGKIVSADSDGANTQNFIGFSLAVASGDGSVISVQLVGPNLAGALTGLGFSTGDVIYLSEAGGYTNDPNSFSGDDDSIIKLGIADCAVGIASATATDLIAFPDVLVSP